MNWKSLRMIIVGLLALVGWCGLVFKWSAPIFSWDTYVLSSMSLLFYLDLSSRFDTLEEKMVN